MRFKLLLLLILLSIQLMGQNYPYYFSHQIDSILAIDSTQWKYQVASWNYSYIGDYKKALEVKDKQYPNAKPSEPSKEQAELFKNYAPIDAKQAILKEASKTQFIIINEAHHMGLHRIYLSTLLSDLYKLGYTFIGMEALSYEDSLLNQRKYPVMNTGFYCKEPCFGNLIRESIEMGFTLFPYEQIFADSLQKSVGREKSEALNIKKLFDKNPNAKFIIYCGHDHLAEDTLKNFMGLPMAGQLKNLTGINPFTIDQTALTEYYLVGNRYRKLINNNSDVLFIDSNGRYFNKANLPKVLDCHVFHPNTTYIYNRPNWLLRPHTKFILLQDKITIDYPYIIKIYLANDDKEKAVPIDVVEVTSEKEVVASLVYRRKKQIAVVINAKGERQEISIGK